MLYPCIRLALTLAQCRLMHPNSGSSAKRSGTRSSMLRSKTYPHMYYYTCNAAFLLTHYQGTPPKLIENEVSHCLWRLTCTSSNPMSLSAMSGRASEATLPRFQHYAGLLGRMIQPLPQDYFSCGKESFEFGTRQSERRRRSGKGR